MPRSFLCICAHHMNPETLEHARAFRQYRSKVLCRIIPFKFGLVWFTCGHAGQGRLLIPHTTTRYRYDIGVCNGGKAIFRDSACIRFFILCILYSEQFCRSHRRSIYCWALIFSNTGSSSPLPHTMQALHGPRSKLGLLASCHNKEYTSIITMIGYLAGSRNTIGFSASITPQPSARFACHILSRWSNRRRSFGHIF